MTVPDFDSSPLSLGVPAGETSAPPEPWVELGASRHLLDWMADAQVSLAFTNYQTGKVFLVGRKTNQAMSVFERTFNHCMGLWVSPDAQVMWLSSKFQVWRFACYGAQVIPHQRGVAALDDEQLTAPEATAAIPGWASKGYDVAYVPRVGFVTGDLDVHDLAVDRHGRLVFVNTLFGCLATVSDTANFQPLWQPPFLSALLPEDRCHLNGLAMRDGRPAFVTALAASDVADGWRDRRKDGGVIIDIESGELVAQGLSMPHSPRWYRDRLWILNSGTGELGHVDPRRGSFEPVAFCPGYLRGLAFVDDHAIVTLSRPRHRTFQGLELDERLRQRGAEAQCGLQVIDLKSGTVAHWLRVEGAMVSELYDVAVLPKVRQPMAIGFQTNEIERLVTVAEPGSL